MKKITIFTDCSFKKIGHTCGLGIVGYIDDKECFFAKIPKYNVQSSTHGETLAAFEALNIALAYKDDFFIQLNTDCEHVYFILAEIKEVKENDSLVKDILELKKNFLKFDVQLIKRNLNKEADKLASSASRF